MKTARRHFGFGNVLLALAVPAVSAAAYAQEEDVATLTKPQSTMGVGAGLVSGNKSDRALFGQYNGMREHNGYLLLDLDYVNRDDATGTWTTARGRNLGLDTREFGVTQQKQGSWRLSVDYNEIVRHDPRTINTGLAGAGTTTPTVNLINPGTGTDLNLQLKRKGIGISGENWFTPSLQFEASFKNEDKDGARLWGRGFNCTRPANPATAGGSSALPAGVCIPGTVTGDSQWAILMLPEPVHSNIKQIETKLNYTRDKLTLVGGYYGSLYTNSNGNMTATVPGTLFNGLGAPVALNADLQSLLQLPTALPPDNQAHQLSLAGTYAFTQTTRANFKYAYTRYIQNRDFAAMGFTGPPGTNNLDGRMDTNLLQAGITTRPMQKLSLLANFRWEDRKDKTPDAAYNVEGATGNPFANTQSSLKRVTSKLEASYQLPDNYRATAGIDYELMDRGVFGLPDSVGGVSGLRQKTWELGERVELRRSISETLTGAISYGHSRRDGSEWLKPNTLPATGVTAMSDNQIFNRTGIFPMIFTDRMRDKVKLFADWLPMEPLSLQFAVETAVDRYLEPGTKGLRDAHTTLYSIDAAWTLSEKWKLTGYVSEGDQLLHIDHSSGYMAALKDVNSSVGLGAIGKATGRLDVGGNLAYIRDNNIYSQGLDQAASAANIAFFNQFGGLPDVTFIQTRISLFGQYALDRSSSIRLDVVRQITKLNEWTWGYNGVPFLYSDGTTISMNQNQHVSFVGASYIYRF